MNRKPVRVVKSKGQVSSRSETANLIPDAGDYVVVFRERPRWLVLRCPSGCGEEVPINIDSRAGKAWRLYLDKRGLTLYPSVIRETGCHSHFVVWNDRVVWCSADDIDDRWLWEEPVGDSLRKLVLDAVRANGPIHYIDLADSLREIPWQVLTACRALKKERQLREETGFRKGVFYLPENAK
jgi:hypothetical protein